MVCLACGAAVLLNRRGRGERSAVRAAGRALGLGCKRCGSCALWVCPAWTSWTSVLCFSVLFSASALGQIHTCTARGWSQECINSVKGSLS